MRRRTRVRFPPPPPTPGVLAKSRHLVGEKAWGRCGQQWPPALPRSGSVQSSSRWSEGLLWTAQLLHGVRSGSTPPARPSPRCSGSARRSTLPCGQEPGATANSGGPRLRAVLASAPRTVAPLLRSSHRLRPAAGTAAHAALRLGAGSTVALATPTPVDPTCVKILARVTQWPGTITVDGRTVHRSPAALQLSRSHPSRCRARC